MATIKSYDVFISYRRAGDGFATAQAVKLHLEKAGYRVFLDVEALRDGAFDQALLGHIERARYFVVVLTPDSLRRCYQEGDWVYREIEHAFATNKTIAPIMTRDFAWPTEPPRLDELKRAVSPEKAVEVTEILTRLSKQNGIAAGPENFVDAMRRLKKFLPLAWYRKFLIASPKRMAAAGLLLLLVAGILGIARYRQYEEFVAASEQVAQLMGVELASMESDLTIVAGRVDDAWKRFAEKCRANPAGVDLYDDELLKEVQDARKFFAEHVQKDVAPSAETLDVLRKNGVDIADVRAFYEVCRPADRQWLVDYLNAVENAAGLTRKVLLAEVEQIKTLRRMEEKGEDVSRFQTLNFNVDLYDAITQGTYRAGELQLQITYVGYLDLLAAMPKSVYPLARKIFEKTTLFKNIPMEQSQDDLESARIAYTNEIERIFATFDTAILAENVAVEEASRANLEATNEHARRGAAQRDKIEALENKIDETIAKTQSVYDEAAAKFALVEEDSFGVCWGKILRLAAFLRLNRVMEITPTQKILSDITERIDRCVELCADEADGGLDAFATAAKRYFALLAEGKIEDAGLIVAFIENDATHPNLRPGDIIWKVDGKLVHNFDEYESLTADKFGRKIERLRFDADGEPTFETYETVEGSPRIAIMPFTEDE